jgi:hypothetical protein
VASGAGVLLAAGLLALSGCTFTAGAPASSSPSPVTPTTPTSATVAATASAVATPGGGSTVGLPPVALPSSTAPRRCSDRVLEAKAIHLRGSRGSVHWDLKVPELSGAASASAVNRHVRASAQDAIDLGLREGRDDAGTRRDVEGEGKVTTSDRRTVQVELRWGDYLAGTAHPTDHVATTVVTTDTGRPLRLRDVLADEPSGLRVIAKAIKPMARPSDPSGLAPKAKNFAAWQTTRDGMRFTFGDYQLGGHGLRSYTVPWRTMRPLLSDLGTGLLDPDVDPTTC